MKLTYLKSALLVMAITTMIGCKNENEAEASEKKQEAKASASAVTYNVNTNNSHLNWKGSKITGGTHNGKIMLQDGKIMVMDKKVQSGEFTIDMNSINVEDLEGEKANQLKGHLTGSAEGKTTDFFNTQKYPTAKFVVTDVMEKNGKTMMAGNLTLKNKTKNIKFPVTVNYQGDKMMLKSEMFAIDRTQWGIEYGSSSLTDVAKDQAISDEMMLEVDVTATKA